MRTISQHSLMMYPTTFNEKRNKPQRRGSHSSHNSCSHSESVENPFAFRTSKPIDDGSGLPPPPTSVYLRESSSSLGSSSGDSGSSSSLINATHLVKLLTLILVGFAGGLLYHLTMANQHTTTTTHEQLLQANDQIVQQLATENQQQTQELERLRQEIEQQNESVQRLRTRNQLIESIEQHEAHPEQDPHAILWTNEVHDARLEAAHRQAEALLRMRRHPEV